MLDLMVIDVERFIHNWEDGCFAATTLARLTNMAPHLITTLTGGGTDARKYCMNRRAAQGLTRGVYEQREGAMNRTRVVCGKSMVLSDPGSPSRGTPGAADADVDVDGEGYDENFERGDTVTLDEGSPVALLRSLQ